MDGFDEKLNKLLQNPEALAQVAELAKNFQGGGSAGEKSEPSGGGFDPGILNALSGIDPRTLSRVAGLLGDFGAKDDRRAQLLTALRPYVRKSRQDKMDHAVQMLQLAKVAQKAMGLFGGS